MSMIFVISLIFLPLTAVGGSIRGDGCVDGASRDFCSGDWTYHDSGSLSGKCCLKTGGWATCEESSYDFCGGAAWTYLGNSKCCTDQYVQCEDASYDFCSAPWKYLGPNKCCLTSAESQPWVTCEESSYDFCGAPWQYFGNSKCCVTDLYVHCEDAAYDFCSAPWKYLGPNKCCLTGKSRPQVTCEESSYDFCSAPWTYLGNSKCCNTESLICNGNTYMGSWAEGTCTSDCQTTHGYQTYDYDWCLLSDYNNADWCWCDAPVLALASNKARISPQMLAICSVFVAGFSLTVMAWYVGHGGQRQPAEEPLLLA